MTEKCFVGRTTCFHDIVKLVVLVLMIHVNHDLINLGVIGNPFFVSSRMLRIFPRHVGIGLGQFHLILLNDTAS
ncbi:Uncharacterised protein [Streptococcus pneumoniae]|nr:Uncharacterised protein [Streptococcus pneumoniae]